jgi:predicted nucleotidyltransferase
MLIENCNKALVEAYDANDELRELKARIKEDYAYFAGADNTADTEDQLNFLFRSKLAMENLKSERVSESLKYKEALEEIVKRPQRSETCRMIAQKALGLLTDEDSQPELLIEENLKLKIELEDLKAKHQ